MPAPIILCADDYAMTGGATDGILSLAESGRLSAASTMVTTGRWPTAARAIAKLRDRIAVGLHLNLTHEAPLGAMPSIAPDNRLPSVGDLIRRSMAGRINGREISAEIARQLDRFQSEAGYPPDFVDGHQHVHVLPGIRSAVLSTLQERFPAGGLMIRDPSDRLWRIFRRRVALSKALTVRWLARGFAREIGATGFFANAGFSGFSTFGSIPYATEFRRFLIALGPRPMIMCHPGLADPEATDDRIAARRPEEHAVLSSDAELPARLWHPSRSPAAKTFPWGA